MIITEATQSKIDDIANHLKNILLEPAKIVGICKQGNGNSKKSKKAEIRNPWFDAECNDSRKRYLKFKRGMPKQPSNYVKAVLWQLAKKHKILIRKKKRRYDRERNAILRELKSTNPGEYWSILNEDKKCTKTGDISINAHRDHFRALNKSEQVSIEEPITQNRESNEAINQAFTTNDVTNHIRFLKTSKTPGIDIILNEFIKNCPDELIPVIIKLFNIILETGIIPTEWTVGIIKPLYKNKGDINDVNNYRGITLLSCIGKLFTSMLNTRLYT